MTKLDVHGTRIKIVKVILEKLWSDTHNYDKNESTRVLWDIIQTKKEAKELGIPFFPFRMCRENKIVYPAKLDKDIWRTYGVTVLEGSYEGE